MSFVDIGIYSSTVKSNILFGKEYDAQLFRRVTRAAALESVSETGVTLALDRLRFVQDFAQLPRGMNTIVGDQGVMLSGVRMDTGC
jgi:ABC-type multidrug transport system fused ATPase/permease subunit